MSMCSMFFWQKPPKRIAILFSNCSPLLASELCELHAVIPIISIIRSYVKQVVFRHLLGTGGCLASQNTTGKPLLTLSFLSVAWSLWVFSLTLIQSAGDQMPPSCSGACELQLMTLGSMTFDHNVVLTDPQHSEIPVLPLLPPLLSLSNSLSVACPFLKRWRTAS